MALSAHIRCLVAPTLTIENYYLNFCLLRGRWGSSYRWVCDEKFVNWQQLWGRSCQFVTKSSGLSYFIFILKFRQKSGRVKIDACRIGLNIAPETAVGSSSFIYDFIGWTIDFRPFLKNDYLIMAEEQRILCQLGHRFRRSSSASLKGQWSVTILRTTFQNFDYT